MNTQPRQPWVSRTELLSLTSSLFGFLLMVHIANTLESDAPFAQLVIMIFRLIVMVLLIVMQIVCVVCLLRERTAQAKLNVEATPPESTPAQ